MKYSNTKTLNLVESTLFASRWILFLLYLGLCIGLALYSYKFVQELLLMAKNIQELTTELTMLSLLGLVDIAMVGNLVIMIAIGGYSIFIREINPEHISNRPRFMNHITASGLKVKMGSSLIGVSSIHLLKKFIETAENHDGHSTTDWSKIGVLLAIHGVFVVSTVALSYIDRPHPKDDNKTGNHNA